MDKRERLFWFCIQFLCASAVHSHPLQTHLCSFLFPLGTEYGTPWEKKKKVYIYNNKKIHNTILAERIYDLRSSKVFLKSKENPGQS